MDDSKPSEARFRRWKRNRPDGPAGSGPDHQDADDQEGLFSPADPNDEPDKVPIPDGSVVRDEGPWTHRDVSANGIRFHIVEAGTGPLVILLHGFGQYWRAWRYQLPGLAQAGFRVVAPDLRGYGDTDKTQRGYDAFTLADDVAGLVRGLGERDAVLVGHGYGGVTAFNTAVMKPAQVRGVVAIAAPHPIRMARIRRPVQSDRYGRLLTWAGGGRSIAGRSRTLRDWAGTWPPGCSPAGNRSSWSARRPTPTISRE